MRVGESATEGADLAKGGRNAVAAPATPNCRNNSLRRMRMVPFLFLVRELSSSTKYFRLLRVLPKGAPCARRIPGDEVYCTTSVSGIEWTKVPDVPVIVRL